VKLAVDVAAYLPGTHTSQTPSPDHIPTNQSHWIIATYCYRRVDRDDVPLLDEQLAGLVAELANFGLGYRSACSQLGDRPGEEEANVSTSWSDQKGIGKDRRAHLSRSLMMAVVLVLVLGAVAGVGW
jgi:hypothetical protein